MDVGSVGWVFTVLLCGAIGGLLAGRRRSPAGPKEFLVLAAVAAVGYYVGVQTVLFGVAEFRVLLRWAIVSACVGGCLGLIVGNLRRSRDRHVQRDLVT